jgi:hypothetical protein
VTFQFLHAGVMHLAVNMMSLYFFGPLVEDYLGQRRFIVFYLLCGIAGAVSFMLLNFVGVLNEGSAAHLVGASAGILGILMAAATRVAPDEVVMLMFPPIPMKLKTMGVDGDCGIYNFLQRAQRRRRSGPPGWRGARLSADSTSGDSRPYQHMARSPKARPGMEDG